MSLRVSAVHSFLFLSSIPVWIGCSFFIHLLREVCLQLRAITKEDPECSYIHARMAVGLHFSWARIRNGMVGSCGWYRWYFSFIFITDVCVFVFHTTSRFTAKVRRYKELP